MSDQAQSLAGERPAISWRAAVEGSDAAARVFRDGRPVYGVDAAGRVVVANQAAAAFGGGAVRFGAAVPPGGTVAALVARFAAKAQVGESAFERTRAVIGLRASMLGLKLAKIELAPLGPLTLVTFAEGIAPLPDEGGVIGDPRDEVYQDEVRPEDTAAPAAPGEDAPTNDAPADPAPLALTETPASDIARSASEPSVAASASAWEDGAATMEDPFSDASFAAFSPISIDPDEWTTPAQHAPVEVAESTTAPAVAPPMAAALIPDAATREPDNEAAMQGAPASREDLHVATPDVIEVTDETHLPLSVPSEPEGDAVVAPTVADLPVAGDAITLGLWDRPTPADSAYDRAGEGVASLLALDGVEASETVSEAVDAEVVEYAEIEADLAALDVAEPPSAFAALGAPDAAVTGDDDAVLDTAPEPERTDTDKPFVPEPPTYQGRAEPHRFVWQMDGARRFTLVSRELADAVGRPGEQLVGRSWGDVAGALGLDPDGKVEAALNRRDTWSGLTVMWPVEGVPVRVPVDLAALPSFGRNRSFDGYRGFGVCRTADWQADPTAHAEPTDQLTGETTDNDEIEMPVADATSAELPSAELPSTETGLAEAPAATFTEAPIGTHDASEPTLRATNLAGPATLAVAASAATVANDLLSADQPRQEGSTERPATDDQDIPPVNTVTLADGALESAPQTEHEVISSPAQYLDDPSPFDPEAAPSQNFADGAIEATRPVDGLPGDLATDTSLGDIEPAHDRVDTARAPLIDAPTTQDIDAPFAAPNAASDLENEDDPLIRRFNDELHDAAQSAFEDDAEPPPADDLDAARLAPADPDMVAHAEGTALPPDVAPLVGLTEPTVTTALAPDGADLGDAVAELSDYLDPVDTETPMATVADIDHVGLPTWHEATPPSPVETPVDAALSTELTDAANLAGEITSEAAEDAAVETALSATALDTSDRVEPIEVAQILDDVAEAEADVFQSDIEERAADVASVETQLTAPPIEGLPADDRFGLMNAVAEREGEPPQTNRPDRASLSEIAAALNQEMRAREAEALRGQATSSDADPSDADDASPAGTEPPVAFVPPQRPENVIAAPIGPGAKVVTLPAGPRVIDRSGERGPLSPPERDAFRQIARVLGARMEDEPPVATPRLDEAPMAPEDTSTPDALTLDATKAPEPDAPAALMAGALAPEMTDRLIGSLGDHSDARDFIDEERRAISDALDRSVSNEDGDDAEARFVEARALTDLSIDNDEAAFVADGDLDALGQAPDPNQLTLFADADDQGMIDEGADAAMPLTPVDDLVGEGEAARLPPDTAEDTAAQTEATPRHAGSLEQPVLQEFPMAVAVVQGQEIPFANAAFLELLGYASLDDLNAAGGLDALFAGPHALKGWTGDASIRPLPAITRDGAVVPVCVRIAKTRWADAPALVMAMETAERAAAGLTAPVEEAVSSTPAPLEPTEPPGLISAIGDEPRETDDLDPRARVAELEAVLDTATDGVAILDGEGTVVSMNRAGQALFGADAASLEGRKLADLLAPESRRAAQDYLDGLARNGVQSLLNDGREVIALEAGGGLVPLFMTIGRLGEGRARAFCAVMRDITQWKKAEEELTAAKKHAELASLHKSDFLAKISHEIRTPLNAIMGFAEVMIDERFGPIGTERYKEYLKDIRTSGAHIMSLVNDLLDLSKIEAGKLDLKFEAVDLNAILRECVALMQPQANRERIIIRASLPTQVPPIVADGRSIRQIMLNLLSNAVKFTPAGGQVIVSTALEDQGQVALRVRDTGIGMTETEVTQALEPFRQVHTAKSGAAGTGLGLPLTKALVEANRAAFAIRSTPGQGTLVEIVFPSTRVLAS